VDARQLRRLRGQRRKLLAGLVRIDAQIEALRGRLSDEATFSRKVGAIV
jgi:hypothetical protein